MCDQTEVSYLENDVVWVKFGSIWWPGVVKDLEKDEEGREILAGLKKKPIATVKFFQEDNYEFVKNLDHIYHYSCRRKDEFIKKGLDRFRSGASHMKKFPADVTTAESLVHGDVNIINDPKFYPEQKQSYSEIFGSGKKKTKKDAEYHSKPRSQSSSTPYRPITHQRFINKVLHGESDHQVRTLLQPAISPEENMSKGTYKCHVCKFETTRVNVIVAHHRLSHSPANSINWIGSDTKAVRRKPVYRSRKPKVKRLSESLKVDSSDDEFLVKKKGKHSTEKMTPTKSKGKSVTPGRSAPVTPRKRKTSEDDVEDKQKRPRFTDVLLADWSEEDEEEKTPHEFEKGKEVDGDRDDCEVSSSPDGLKKDDITETERGKDDVTDMERGKDEFKDDAKNQNEKMSCFDFDEEEEGFIGMSNANTYGRKIPRVIPVKDKSELGVDLEIGELFKRKNEQEEKVNDDSTSTIMEEKSSDNEVEPEEMSKEIESEDVVDEEKDCDKEEKTENTVKRRRKSSKEQEIKVDENSLAVRRTRRPGAKKSYLNEVIEKIEDVDNSTPPGKSVSQSAPEIKNSLEISNSNQRKPGKDVPTSSSRRKQDLKLQTTEDSLEETVYTDMLNNELKTKNPVDRKSKEKSLKAKNIANEDLTKRIDHLLAETNVPDLPDIPSSSDSKAEKQNNSSESLKASNTLNFSFDYISPNDDKNKSEKSITKMFSDTVQGSDSKQDRKDQLPNKLVAEAKDSLHLKQDGDESSHSLLKGDLKTPSQTNGDFKKLSLPDDHFESSHTGNTTNEDSSTNIIKRIDVKGVVGEPKENQGISTDGSENVNRTKNVKTIKLKADALPSSLLSPTGKLKGQTIIHQKGGTYVILSQPQQTPRPKVTAAKAQAPGKVLILTNQLGEQKIITTSGIQQNKFKIEPQKLIVASSNGNSTDSIASTSGVISVGKTQPVIKMVPDGKGGIVKQLTVSPKKVIVGGTKVLVSGAGTTLTPQGSTIQKIAFSGGNNLSGDYRLIENYKGSGKTVLIQGSSNAPTSVLLKTGAQRSAIGDNIQGSQNVSNIKKKPNIVMRAAPFQNEYVVHSDMAAVDTPTYVMKRKGADGKFSTQKIFRRPVISSSKTKSSMGSKTIFLSSDQGAQKTEPLIIKTNHEPSPSKIIRLSHKIKEADAKQKFPQRIIQKASETYSVPSNSVFTMAESEEQGMKNETAQVLELSQGQSQQAILQTQVMAMPGPIGSDGNQTYVLVSVDERGVVQPVDNSLIAYETGGQTESVFVNSNPSNNVILINPQSTSEGIKPVYSNGGQDILAEALANTNVLEGNMNNEMDSVIPSILLPPSIPSSVVQETSVTLQKPIMTPLEMPTSVTPDTSDLEPPPLPPTPTEEDVLMEDQETELQVSDGLKEEAFNIGNIKQTADGKAECLIAFKNVESIEPSYKVGETEILDVDPRFKRDGEGDGYREENQKEAGKEYNEKASRNDYNVETFQEEEGSGSFQSMPLLNDEPDTSDDAQDSEPIADQDFELQKSRAHSEDLPSLLTEQEPPSSTNNEVMEEKSGCDAEQAVFQETPAGDNSKIAVKVKPQEESKVKEVMKSKETHSMPDISEDGNMSSYASVGQIYVDSLSLKKFQETEVTSTTNEFSNKDNHIV